MSRTSYSFSYQAVSEMEGPRKNLGPGELLSEDEANRLLARAVELDAQHQAAVSVEELQRAACEAGIEPNAFIQALAELRSGALEPLTIGQRFASSLARYRGLAALAAFVSAAGFTPGDAVVPSMFIALGLYGAFEGLTALARYFGKTPPRIPPDLQRAAVPSMENPPERQDPPEARFVLARQNLVAVASSIV